jgi:hypothetical protein
MLFFIQASSMMRHFRNPTIVSSFYNRSIGGLSRSELINPPFMNPDESLFKQYIYCLNSQKDQLHQKLSESIILFSSPSPITYIYPKWWEGFMTSQNEDSFLRASFQVPLLAHVFSKESIYCAYFQVCCYPDTGEIQVQPLVMQTRYTLDYLLCDRVIRAIQGMFDLNFNPPHGLVYFNLIAQDKDVQCLECRFCTTEGVDVKKEDRTFKIRLMNNGSVTI